MTDPKYFRSTFGDFFDLNKNKSYVSWVFDCIEVYAKYFTKANFCLYDKTQDDEIEEHPIKTLFSKPNPYQTRWEIFFRMAQHWALYGNCYLYKLKNSMGIPVQLIQLLPFNTSPRSTGESGGIDYFDYEVGGKIYSLKTEDVIHFRNPDPDNLLIGVPLIARILDQSEVDQLQTAYMKQFYKQGGFLGQVFTTDKVMTKDSFNRAKQELADRYSGVDNAFKVALFDSNLKAENVTNNLRDMDFSNTRNHTRDEIFSAFNINKFLIGQSEGINRANAFEISRQFISGVIEPIFEYMDEVLTVQLCHDFDQDYYVKHESISPRDVENDLMYYDSGIKAGWLTPNEVRAWEDLEPINADYMNIPLDLSKQNNNSNQTQKQNEAA